MCQPLKMLCWFRDHNKGLVKKYMVEGEEPETETGYPASSGSRRTRGRGTTASNRLDFCRACASDGV